MTQKFFFKIEPPLNTLRADRLIHELCADQAELTHLSRSQIQRLIESGQIISDGKPIRSKDQILEGSLIEINIPDPRPLEVTPENIPLTILFEDEHLLVINKQPRLTVHPSGTQLNGTLVNALLHHVKDLSGIGGILRPGIVHRIDKNTSGALVVTKTDAAHAGLSKLFATHDIKRTYWALVYGSPKIDGTLTVRTTIGRNPGDRKKMAVNVDGGRSSVTHFKLVESYAVPNKKIFAAWVEATLETGRTHQVRVHLNHLGNSILGDLVYGTPTLLQPKWKSLPASVQESVSNLPGQALHARVLGFKHPISGKELYFEAEPFPEFKAVMDALAHYK